MKEAAAKELVTRFLQAMEARDLDVAESMIAPDAPIIFPGGRRFSSQREMVTAAAGRYQWVKKRLDRIDAICQPGKVIVYVIGRLYGVNRHEIPFDNVRFMDRFVVRDGMIMSQEVWNDLAESGVLEATVAGLEKNDDLPA